MPANIFSLGGSGSWQYVTIRTKFLINSCFSQSYVHIFCKGSFLQNKCPAACHVFSSAVQEKSAVFGFRRSISVALRKLADGDYGKPHLLKQYSGRAFVVNQKTAIFYKLRQISHIADGRALILLSGLCSRKCESTLLVK